MYHLPLTQMSWLFFRHLPQIWFTPCPRYIVTFASKCRDTADMSWHLPICPSAGEHESGHASKQHHAGDTLASRSRGISRTPSRFQANFDVKGWIETVLHVFAQMTASAGCQWARCEAMSRHISTFAIVWHSICLILTMSCRDICLGCWDIKFRHLPEIKSSLGPPQPITRLWPRKWL